MKNLFRKSQSPDVKIEEIISSFALYAFGDIRFNIENKNEAKPIAAFILCSCLIDQLAAYTYNHGAKENAKYYKKFIQEYLPSYVPLRLYKDLRCLLVHNYSISEYLAITNENPFPENDGNIISATHITAIGLYNDLVKAFDKFTKELRCNTETRKNAIARYDDAPPIISVNSRFWKYSEKEADYLKEFYFKKVRGKPVNDNASLIISAIEKTKIDDTNEPFILRCIAIQHGKKYCIQLDKITQQLGLPYPIDILKAAGILE